MLSDKQREIVFAVNQGSNVLMTGPGGVGKSYVISVIKEECQSCMVTAMTGAAAILINGRTLHSSLGIGLAKEPADMLLKKVSRNKRVWNDLKFLIIDEISMLSAELLDKLEYVARHIKRSNDPFGGIKLLLSGDFLQLPTIGGEFCFKAKCWSRLNLVPFVLCDIKRQEDIEFQRILNNARTGNLSDTDLTYLTSGGELARSNIKKGIIPTQIMCKNVDVDELNNRELMNLQSENYNTYEMDVVLSKSDIVIKPELYCPAPKRITLTIGAQVMLLINKDQDAKLVNGSRGVVIDFANDMPVVKFINGATVVIAHHGFEIKEDDRVYGTIYALPLKLAWAITCHKSQGMSVDSAYVNLEGVFEYGQAYVAISRVRSHDSLILENASLSKFKAHPCALKFYTDLTGDLTESKE